MVASSYHIAEIVLSYKNVSDLSHRPKIIQSKDAYEVLLNSWDEEKIGFVEQAKVLLLNQANRVLGIYEFSCGGVAGTICDPKLVFAAALKANASNIILAHNHPSECLTPSRADRTLTEKIKQAGGFFDIRVLDHLIVSPVGYYSFTDDATYDVADLDIAVVKKEPVEPQVRAMVAEAMNISPVSSALPEEGTLPDDVAGQTITRSETSYGLMMRIWEENALDVQRSYKMLCLDRDCRVIGLHHFLEGMTLLTHEDARLVLSLAERDNASHIVLAQNKPYGVILPTTADMDFTAMLTAAGNDHDILLLDYLFLNQNGYYSYNDNEFKLGYGLRPL